MSHRLIGKAVPRKEGLSKVTGKARYIADLDFPGALHGVTVRSPAPRGIIRSINYDAAIPWHEFTIVTAADIPGANCIALIVDDQPCLAGSAVNHCEEPVILLAHPDRAMAEEARRRITFEIDPLPPVFDFEQSTHIFKSFLLERGDLARAFADADRVIEGEYRTGAQEQLYIEPNGMAAIANPRDGVTVWGSLQCPYYVHKALMKLFGLPEDKVRVVQAETGGGFGGKEEYPSLIAGHAALLAWKSGKPVKMIYDREEDMAATTKRHPSRTRIRTAVTRDGKLLGADIDFLIDGGGYATLSSVVLSRGTIHAAGPYVWPAIRVNSRAVATNHPPNGAFRGFGAPQSIFAMERHLHRVAQELGIEPEELRRRNFLREGGRTATGQLISEKLDLAGLMDRAFALSNYHEKRRRYSAENPHSKIRRGIGFATFMHGAGFTGSGERYLQSVVGAEAFADGRVQLLVASTEIGQGTNTIFSQIAAEALHLDYDRVSLAQPDTANVPNSGPTVASRTCMIVGKLVESAALGIKQTLMLPDSYTQDEFTQACARYIEAHGPLKSFSQYQAPPNIFWNDDTYQGDAYGAYAWAVYIADVSVDTVTYEARVEDFVALQEAGKVIHPVLAAGQIEGGVAQGIGFSLYEKVVWNNGRMANAQMTNYIMPTPADLPPIRVFFEEQPYAHGPSGAKGIGELPMDGPAPAICNAMEQALAHPVDQVPVMPEDLVA